MNNVIQENIQSVGKFKLTFINCIDIYVLLNDESKSKIQQWRAGGVVHNHLSEAFSLPEVSAGTFYLTKPKQEPVQSRTKLSMDCYGKSVFTPTFLEKSVPLLFEEHEGQKLSDTAQTLRLGRKTPIKDILRSVSPTDILYESCELRIFREGILSIRCQFSGEGVQVEDFISLILELKKLTRNSLVDKVRSIVKDWNNSVHPFCKLGIRFIGSNELFERNTLLPRFMSGHTIIAIESIKDKKGCFIPIPDLEIQAGLLGILRQTHRAIGYKKELLDSIKEYNIGYKSDEVYITFRDTTLVVLPKHWEPDSYLSIYLVDLTLIIEYYVSKISFLDILALIIHDEEFNEPLEDIMFTKNFANRIISLRKILMLSDESFDVDMVINHYFTRRVLIQLIEQRGIWNKLKSIKNRLSNVDSILELIAQYSFSHLGISANLKQIRIAIWALLATLVFSLASLILAIIQL